MLPPVDPPRDVAELSDTELVEKIEAAWQAHAGIEARKASAWAHFRRFFGLSDHWPSLLRGPGGVGPLHPSLTLEPVIRNYHVLREIRELTDELERRVARRKAQGA
jgi:hypothetical protein